MVAHVLGLELRPDALTKALWGVHDFEELCEIHDIIERGPNWYAIEDIRITLNYRDKIGPLTVEQAEQL